MKNAPITQQHSSNFDQGGYMSQIPPQINNELNVDIQTQSQQRVPKTKLPDNLNIAKPPILQSMSVDPYHQQQSQQSQQSPHHHNNVNLLDFPILEALHPPTDTGNNKNNINHSHSPPLNRQATQATQPPLRAIASAPESYNNNNQIMNGFQMTSNTQPQPQQQQMNYQQQHYSQQYMYNASTQQQPTHLSPYHSPTLSSAHHSYSSLPGAPININTDGGSGSGGGITHVTQQLHSTQLLNANNNNQRSRSVPFTDDTQIYYNQQPQPQPQQNQQAYTSQQLRRMYQQYQDYYKKYKQQQQQTNSNQNNVQQPQQYNKNNGRYNNQQQQQKQQNNGRYKNNNYNKNVNVNYNKNQRQNNNMKNNQNNNNNSNTREYVAKSHSEYMKYLIKTVRDQTEEINQMQQTISHLQNKINTKKLLEEDFYSFLSRIEFPSWISDKDKALCLNKLFQNEKEKLNSELKEAKLSRREAATKNLVLETQIIELTDDISALRDYLEQEKHKNYLQSVNHNKNLAAKLANHNHNNTSNKYKKYNKNRYNNNNHNQNNNNHNHNHNHKADYPPENIIIQTLIRTQIEFYFSDYNLKRDKRLLDQLCSDRIGFLKIDSVMNLTRVRQLSSHRNQVINSLRNSKFLSLTADNEWVGRLGFERPQEKQFPFRRTVFVFGLPMDCSEKYVTEMLSPFGKLSKVKFDHGPDTLDRLVSENMFSEMKVYKYREMRVLYNYKQEIMVGGSVEYTCNKCNKLKQCDEGFYETCSYQTLICLQCAAASAELILEKCKNNAGDKIYNERMIELLCGKSPRDVRKTKTALAVFTSQRQASKCVYVRSRIAYDGCFATHYHHYSKLKKEIALTLQPFQHRLREIPPRRVLHDINNNKLTIQNIDIDPPQLHHQIDSSPESLSIASLSQSESDASELQMNINSKDDNIPKAPKLENNFVSDNKKNTNKNPNNNKFTSPKLKKSSAGSLTAPVVGGKGEIYLMRAAYNKVNNIKDNKSKNKNNNSSINASFVDDAKRQ